MERQSASCPTNGLGRQLIPIIVDNPNRNKTKVPNTTASIHSTG